MAVERQLEELRTNMNPSRLGRKINVSRNPINAIENGKFDPS